MNSSPISRKRFLVMAGGTGGHVYPALSLANELRARGHDVFWLGTEKGIEARLVPAADIELYCIDVFGIRGKGVVSVLKAPFNLIRALMQANRVIRNVAPDLVMGFGGFASGPGGLASRLRRLPLIIHEQNARAGTTNKMLAYLASKVLVAFPNSLPNSKSGSETVGNPVRDEIVAMNDPAQRAESKTGPIRLLVLGGSLGATFLNENIAKAIALIANENRPVVRHQCGERWMDDCKKSYRDANVNAEVMPYIEDMASAYSWADFLICRAGAMTVSEVAVAGVPALFIPFPYAIDDHQTANANWLVEAGAARIEQQAELTPESLACEIRQFSESRECLVDMGEKAREVAITNAKQRIATACEEFANVA